jgi:hypothetical protein
MEHSEYQVLMRNATGFTRSQNAAVWEKWRLEELPRFDWDQVNGTISFGGSSRTVIADIQFLGSWSESAGTWMWAWANDSVEESMKKEVEEVRSFGVAKDLAELTEAVMEGPIEAAWDMASLSCYILRSEMVYRAPDSKKPGFTFLSLRNFRQS